MNISLTIMAHEGRRKRAETMLEKLSKHPFSSCYITWDQVNEEWHTGERALRSGIDAGANWHCVLQDDAIVPDDFYTHLTNAINNVPTRSLISLYTGQSRPFPKRVATAVDRAKGCSFLQFYMLLWGVGIVLPTTHIEPLLEECETRQEPYDTRIGIWYLRNMLPVFYTNPSLVDHDDDLGSLLDHGKAPGRRVAHNYIGNLEDPPRWNNKAVSI